MIELELTAIFVLAIFFSALYEVSNRTALCAFAWICWWIFSLYWITSGSLAFIAYLPFGIGWVYLIRLFIDLIDIRKARRELD